MENLTKTLHQISAASRVEEARQFCATILNMDYICVGGSAALLVKHNIYLGRPVHDIDIIVEKYDFNEIFHKLSEMAAFFEINLKRGSYKLRKGSQSNGFSITLKTGTEINFLVGAPAPYQEWQDLDTIVSAKRYYNRPKDRKDLAIIFG